VHIEWRNGCSTRTIISPVKVVASSPDDTKPFPPYKDRTTTLQYYKVPIEVLDDREIPAEWAINAYLAGLKQKRIISVT